MKSILIHIQGLGDYVIRPKNCEILSSKTEIIPYKSEYKYDYEIPEMFTPVLLEIGNSQYRKRFSCNFGPYLFRLVFNENLEYLSAVLRRGLQIIVEDDNFEKLYSEVVKLHKEQ